jgi:hypothetical protein
MVQNWKAQAQVVKARRRWSLSARDTSVDQKRILYQLVLGALVNAWDRYERTPHGSQLWQPSVQRRNSERMD